MQIITNLTNLLSHTENIVEKSNMNVEHNSVKQAISEITYVGNTPAPYVEDDGLIAW